MTKQTPFFLCVFLFVIFIFFCFRLSYRTLASVCLRFLRYRLWYFCRSVIEPCSACILLLVDDDGGGGGGGNGNGSVVGDDAPAVVVLRLVAFFTESVGDGDCTTFLLVRCFWYVTLVSGITASEPPFSSASSSSSSPCTESSSAISCRWGEGWRARGGGLSSGTMGGAAGGDGGAALPSAGPHQGRQHFQTPTSVAASRRRPPQLSSNLLNLYQVVVVRLLSSTFFYRYRFSIVRQHWFVTN